MAEMIQIPPVLSVPEAAEYLRASTEHVYNLLRRGELTSVRAGHRRLIRRIDIDAMLNARAEEFRPRARRKRKTDRPQPVDIFA